MCKIPIKWPTRTAGWADIIRSLKAIFFKRFENENPGVLTADAKSLGNTNRTQFYSFSIDWGVRNTGINKRRDRAKALLTADTIPSNEINLKRPNCGNTSHMPKQENNAEYSSYISTVKETLTAFCHPVHNQSHCTSIIHPNVLRS